jgi:hypothetical protein
MHGEHKVKVYKSFELSLSNTIGSSNYLLVNRPNDDTTELRTSNRRSGTIYCLPTKPAVVKTTLHRN